MKSLLEIFLENPLVSTDSRNILPKSLFFALKGENFDANFFAKDALDKGAIFAVVDNPNMAINQSFILVDDVLKSLQDLAKQYLQYLKQRENPVKVIGITGTNGKTTSKELIKAVLAKKFKVHATEGNLNNHIGVPLTILTTPLDAEILIVEMGANHCGEIADLCQIAMPDFGIITSLGKAHLEGFGSFENIIDTKIALYQSVKQNQGIVFVNAENDILMEKSASQKRFTYGSEMFQADVKGSFIDNGSTTVSLKISGENIQIDSHLFGIYNFFNIMSALCIGKYFAVKTTDIADAISNYIPANNRSQIIKTDKNEVIMDAYNANPTSMKLAIESFKNLDNKDKFFILGDMLELGEASEKEHQNIVNLFDNQKDNIIFIGENFYKIYPEKSFKTLEDFFKILEKQPLIGKTILVKASHGLHFERMLPML